MAPFALLLVLGVVGLSTAYNGQLTHYCSYSPCCESNISPPYTDAEHEQCPGNTECEDYSACRWEGQFAYCGSKSHEWVIKNNIVALFSTHGDQSTFINKNIRIWQNGKSIDAVVCDTCGDSDCGGCCTDNAEPSGYLIDLEANTFDRSGFRDGSVTWECLDC